DRPLTDLKPYSALWLMQLPVRGPLARRWLCLIMQLVLADNRRADFSRFVRWVQALERVYRCRNQQRLAIAVPYSQLRCSSGDPWVGVGLTTLADHRPGRHGVMQVRLRCVPLGD